MTKEIEYMCDRCGIKHNWNSSCVEDGFVHEISIDESYPGNISLELELCTSCFKKLKKEIKDFGIKREWE